jgi:hypothetical protein
MNNIINFVKASRCFFNKIILNINFPNKDINMGKEW